MTLLQDLVQSLKQAGHVNRNAQAKPAAVLWTDPDSQWASVLSVLRRQLPELLTLGAYDPEQRQGPAIWLKCAISGLAPEVGLPSGSLPILYLAGVSRHQLRAIEDCPLQLRPLAELQYRGAFWSQANHKDWTVNAFLCSKHGGLGLEVSQDQATQAAIRRALEAGQLLTRERDELAGKLLEASFFDGLVAPDPSRDLLEWLNEPQMTQQEWAGGRWDVFVKRCKQNFGFDPERDGDLTGAEKLAAHAGFWKPVWRRYVETHHLFPKIADLLERVPLPQDLFADHSGYPSHNAEMEKQLQQRLQGLDQLLPDEARTIVLEEETRHGVRRSWLWATLGQAGLAQALEPLAYIASMAKVPTGNSPQAMADAYCETHWRIDEAALKALTCARTQQQERAIEAALKAIYAPWLEKTAERFQELVKAGGGLGGPGASDAYPEGQCVFFVDGLRYDVAQMLSQRLAALSMPAALSTGWTTIPSVTASGKPRVSPVSAAVAGRPDSKEFEPCVDADGKPLSTHHFRKLLTDSGWQVLTGHETGDPAGRAWVEHGDLDHYGHEHGLRLAKDLDAQLTMIVERLQALREAGWRRFRIVTDHGWLLVPGGMPSVKLEKFLAETRWGRCAILKESAAATPLTFGWDWCSNVQVALAPGISSFIAGAKYAHGGLSLQECLVPILDVVLTTATSALPPLEIAALTWQGMRCRIEVTPSMEGLTVDLREHAAMPDSSWAEAPKPLNEGKATLMVSDDHEGKAAHLVVLDPDGHVVQKTLTTIGG